MRYKKRSLGDYKEILNLKKSNVLVTGGCGFIGSTLVRELEKLKCKVTVIDNLCAGKKEHLDGTKADFVEGDIRNLDLLKEIRRRDKPKFVFHLAAEPFIPKGYQNPEVMFETNTLGTINILKTFGRTTSRIMYWSTSEVYGTARTLPMSETHPTTPHSIYALAKFAADRACFILWKEKRYPVVILRQFNCFSEDTEIVTPLGIKKISKLKVGDPIFTLNPETKEIEFDTVMETQEMETEELYSFKHKSLDFLVSSDQRFFLRQSNRERFNWFTAEELSQKKNQYSFPVHKELSSGLDSYNEDLLKLIAWYITEGYPALPYETRICQRRTRFRSEIKELIAKLDFHPIETYHYIGLSSRKLTKFLVKKCGKGSYKKRMPKFIFNLSPRLRRLFFKTLMKGDGTKSRLRYSTVSKQLAEDMLLLGLINGLRGRIRKENKEESSIYRIEFRTSPTSIKTIKHITFLKKKIKVYDITAAKNHIIYAGRKGIFNWVGQCFGPRECQPYIIPVIIKQFTEGNELHLGNLNAKRDFTWVNDACRGVIKLVQVPSIEGQVVNLGRGKNWSIKEIVDITAKVMNKKDYNIIVERKRLRPFDVDELLCDNTLFNQLTGGIKYVPFEEGLKKLVDWYNKHGQKWVWE